MPLLDFDEFGYESKKHLQMKVCVKKLFPSSILENVINGRPNDVTIPQDKVAVEVQCSQISEQEILDRTLHFNKSGYAVLWILGNRNDEELESYDETRITTQERCLKRLYRQEWWVYHKDSFSTVGFEKAEREREDYSGTPYFFDLKRTGIIKPTYNILEPSLHHFFSRFMFEREWQAWGKIKSGEGDASKYLLENSINLKLASFMLKKRELA